MGNNNVENNTTVRPYVRANAGVQNFDWTVRPIATGEIGARLTKGNLRAEAGAEIGTGVGAQANVNYRFSTSQNGKFGVDVQANGSYSHPFTGGTRMTATYLENGVSDIPRAIFRPDRYKAAAGVNFNYAPNEKLNLNAGFEAGVLGAKGKKSVTASTPDAQTGITMEGHPSLYMSPTLGADYNINRNLSVGIQADLSEAKARVTYVF